MECVWVWGTWKLSSTAVGLVKEQDECMLRVFDQRWSISPTAVRWTFFKTFVSATSLCSRKTFV